MKFVCDSCHAQYMISDDKVGANGVKVRCKKCSHVIVVKRVAEPDPTSVMANPMTTDPGSPAQGGAGAPFGGIGLDEIGQAFDSVLAGGDAPPGGATVSNPFNQLTGETGTSESPIAAAGSKAGDFDATSVMNLKELAGLAAQSEPAGGQLPDGLKAGAVLNGSKSPLANGHANGKANGTSAEIPQTDWYVAIDDEQQGPVTLDFVKKAWEEGKVTTDSLVWRNGYGDWIPLSTVPDLVKVLTPIPVPRKSALSPVPADADKPAGAIATGSQTPWSGGAAPSAVHDPDAVDWKPAAASALASLVQEEMAALSKPTPKKTAEPFGVGEGTSPKMKGLLDLADEPVPSKSALADEPPSPKGLMGDSVPALAAAPSGSALTDMPPEPMVRPPPQAPVSDPQIEVRSPRLPANRPPTDSQRYDREEVPEYPPRANYVPPARTEQNNNAKYMVLGIFVLCGTGLGIAYMFKPTAAPPPTEVADARPPPTPALPVVAHPVPVAPAPTPAPSPTPAAPTTAAAPTPTPPAATPAATPTPAPAVAAPTPAAAPAAVAAKSGTEEEAESGGKKKHKKHHKGASAGGDEGETVASASEPTPAVAAPAPVAAPEPPPKKAGPPPKQEDLLSTGSKSKIDNDFDKLLGGGGSEPAAEAPAPAKKQKKEAVYIPGDMASNLPDQLSQGDVMSVVAGHKDNIKKCVASDPDLAGNKVVMHWVIQTTGATSGVKCNSAEQATSPGTKCLGKEIRQWKFPQFKGAPMPIDFPFKF